MAVTLGIEEQIGARVNHILLVLDLARGRIVKVVPAVQRDVSESHRGGASRAPKKKKMVRTIHCRSCSSRRRCSGRLQARPSDAANGKG